MIKDLSIHGNKLLLSDLLVNRSFGWVLHKGKIFPQLKILHYIINSVKNPLEISSRLNAYRGYIQYELNLQELQ